MRPFSTAAFKALTAFRLILFSFAQFLLAAKSLCHFWLSIFVSARILAAEIPLQSLQTVCRRVCALSLNPNWDRALTFSHVPHFIFIGLSLIKNGESGNRQSGLMVRFVQEKRCQSSRTANFARIKRVSIARKSNKLLLVMNVVLVVRWLVLELLPDCRMNIYAFNRSIAIGQECEGGKSAIRKDAGDGLIRHPVNINKQVFSTVEVTE